MSNAAPNETAAKKELFRIRIVTLHDRDRSATIVVHGEGLNLEASVCRARGPLEALFSELLDEILPRLCARVGEVGERAIDAGFEELDEFGLRVAPVDAGEIARFVAER